MAPRYPVRWLMTDERMGDALWPALHRLPPGSGVVLRHYTLLPTERQRLVRRVTRIARARRLLLLVADRTTDGYGPMAYCGRFGRAAHDRREAIAGARAGATWLFVSPVFATRSHPGAPHRGPMATARIAAGLGVRTIAMGGMTERRWRRIARLGFDGWAGIDAWLQARD